MSPSASPFLKSRSVEDHCSLCPAAAAVGETIAGSGVLCRITGNLVTTGENPSSLKSFCWNQFPSARAESVNGEVVEHGYQNCPVWRYNRQAELAAKGDPEFRSERGNREFVTAAST